MSNDGSQGRKKNGKSHGIILGLLLCVGVLLVVLSCVLSIKTDKYETIKITDALTDEVYEIHRQKSIAPDIVRNILLSLGMECLSAGLITGIILQDDKSDDENTAKLTEKVEELTRVVSGQHIVAGMPALKIATMDLIKTTVQSGAPVRVRVMGVSLTNFINDHIYNETSGEFAEFLRDRKVELQFIVQDPDNCKIVASREGKDLKQLQEKISKTVAVIKGLRNNPSVKASVKLRMYSDCPTITITQISDTAFVNIRPSKGQNISDPNIFCRYSKDCETEMFQYMETYFNAIWEQSKEI